MRKRKAKEPVVYCGPSIQHVARSFTTYAETPEALKAQAEKCPAITALIVPLSKMAETRKAIKTPGTKEAIFYGHIQKFIQGGI
jgi:hypothetical protein